MMIATPAKTAEWESRQNCNSDYGESGISGPDRLDLDHSGRDACGDGSDGDGGEDGSMGLEADDGAVSEVEGGVDGAGEAAAPAAAIGPGPAGDVVLVGPDKTKKKKNRRGSKARVSRGWQRP
jgi:hypothetical protein